jgi:hypothetical protein
MPFLKPRGRQRLGRPERDADFSKGFKEVAYKSPKNIAYEKTPLPKR